MAVTSNSTYCIVMAGGVGSRFWPMSQEKMPKQFLDILGTGKSLIQQTIDRLVQICPLENILVVTNDLYKDLVLEQIPLLQEAQILCEPLRRNTAPCIAYACYKIKKLNPNANIVVAPSDHLILNEPKFINTIEIAINKAEKANCLVTLGMKPSRPDTGYGYIQFAEAEEENTAIRKVKTFTEKPDLELANIFLESGKFYWNAGIFIWNVNTIITAFEKHLPEVHQLFSEGNEKYNTAFEKSYIDTIYPMCKSISIDYGIMEKADNVFVVLSEFGWSDLGTWGSLYTHIDKDKHNNARIGGQITTYDSNDCLVCTDKNKTVVIQGLNNYIIVDANDTLLICEKQAEQRIKQFVSDLKKGETFVKKP